MKPDQNKKTVRPGIKFRERTSPTVFAVVSVDDRTVSFRSDHGQPEVSFGTCPLGTFETRLANRDLEIIP
jgi:hypothetical protein